MLCLPVVCASGDMKADTVLRVSWILQQVDCMEQMYDISTKVRSISEIKMYFSNRSYYITIYLKGHCQTATATFLPKCIMYSPPTKKCDHSVLQYLRYFTGLFAEDKVNSY